MLDHRPAGTDPSRAHVCWAVVHVLAFTVMLATVARVFVGEVGALVLAACVLVPAVVAWVVISRRDACRGASRRR